MCRFCGFQKWLSTAQLSRGHCFALRVPAWSPVMWRHHVCCPPKLGKKMEQRQPKTGQHFLLSSRLRDLTMWDISNLDKAQVITTFAEFRWGSLDKVICPTCGVISKPFLRVNRSQLRCRHCDRHFSPLVNTVFADRKISLKKLLMGLVKYIASAKGVSALELSRVINVQAKTASVLLGKIRECLLRQKDTEILSGLIEIDGGYFCGKPRKSCLRGKSKPEEIAAMVEARLRGEPVTKKRPKNMAARRNWEKRKNRRVVMVYRAVSPEGGEGAYATRVFISMGENSAVVDQLTPETVAPNSTIMTDENAAYSHLSKAYDHHCVEHSREFCTMDGVNENQAESFFSRMRRAEYGVFHGYRPKYLADYAQEFAWREDVRRQTERQKLQNLLRRVYDAGKSRWWRGYWQGHNRPGEWLVKA